MASIREQTQHFPASSVPLGYPWRLCLSCLYVGPVAWPWWIWLLFVASPGKNRGQWSIKCRPGQNSFILTVVFHSIKLPIDSQPETQKHKWREEVRKKKVMCVYSKVRSRIKAYKFCFSGTLAGETGCYTSCIMKTVKGESTHTLTEKHQQC